MHILSLPTKLPSKARHGCEKLSRYCDRNSLELTSTAYLSVILFLKLSQRKYYNNRFYSSILVSNSGLFHKLIYLLLIFQFTIFFLLQNNKCQVVALDFQILRSGSAVCDLMYFIDFAADDDFRQKYFQKTLDHYYSELCESLRRLNVDPNEVYSQQDFEYELKEVN